MVHGLPSDLRDENETQLIEKLLEDFKTSSKTDDFDKRKNVAKTFAYQTAIKSGKTLDKNSMHNIVLMKLNGNLTDNMVSSENRNLTRFLALLELKNKKICLNLEDLADYWI